MAFKRIQITENVAGIDAPEPPPAPALPKPPTAKPQPAASVKETRTGKIKAGTAVQGSAYVFNGKRFLFLTFVDGQAAFQPVLGGGPLMLPEDAEVEVFSEAAEVLPPDAPAPSKTVATETKREVPVDAVGVATSTTTSTTGEVVTYAAASDAPKKKRTKAAKDGDVTQDNPKLPLETIVFFRGVPVGVGSSTLHEYAAKLEAIVLKAAGSELVDLRTAGDSVLGFGKWKGFLAQAVKENPIEPGLYIVTIGDERIEVVAQALLANGALGVI